MEYQQIQTLIRINRDNHDCDNGFNGSEEEDVEDEYHDEDSIYGDEEWKYNDDGGYGEVSCDGYDNDNQDDDEDINYVANCVGGNDENDEKNDRIFRR